MTNDSQYNKDQETRHVFVKIVREPLLQFLCIGLILFTVNWFIHGSKEQSSSENINISAGQVEQLAEQYRLIAGRMPSDLELQRLINDFIDEEVAYREAIALGLDTNDIIVRRRMRQKLEFLAMDMQTIKAPDDEELLSWLETHIEDYQRRERISFRYILASHDVRGNQTEADAFSFLKILEANPQTENLGDNSMLPATIPLSTEKEVAALFGDTFAKSAIATADQNWSEPIKSAYGYHLIYITERQPARIPSLYDIHETLSADWTRAKQQDVKEEYLKRLRKNYSVHIDWPDQHSATLLNK